MMTLTEHILKLTDHRDRNWLELTLSKALLDLLPVQRIVIARVMRRKGDSRWLEVARLDAMGGGRLIDPIHVDFSTLPPLAEASDRLKCLQSRDLLEIAWAGDAGPRITLLPLFSDLRPDDEGVIEVHSDAALDEEALLTMVQLRRAYRNMYTLLEYSNRDALTGLFNRKSLEDAFYSAVLEELDGIRVAPEAAAPAGLGQERRHRIPVNYWLGSISLDGFSLISDQQGPEVAQQVLPLLARLMNNTFRTCDRLYHFDGAHFGVLIHCSDEALVLAAFERFRINVEKFFFPKLGYLSVSCGLSPVGVDDSPTSALEKTQLALDFAQRSGGNWVCSHLDWVRRGFFGDNPENIDLF
jgi:GGDEF domain-containing protein